MSDIFKEQFKPEITKAAGFIRANKGILFLTVLTVAALWYLADYRYKLRLDKYEFVGFFILVFISLIILKKLFLPILSKFRKGGQGLVILISPLLVFGSGDLQANDLNIIDIPKEGSATYDLSVPALLRFGFSLTELTWDMRSILNDSDGNVDCVIYLLNANSEKRFCGYTNAIENEVFNLIVDVNQVVAYALDLENLQSGGGGNYGTLFEIPNTGVKDFFADNIEIEGMARAILPGNHKDYKKFYTGYGMYGFLLFRDRGGVNRENKMAATRGFLSIFPEFDVASLGVPKSRFGVMVYPSSLSDQEIYSTAHRGGFTEESDENIGELSLTEHYNYDYAAYAIKQVQDKNDVQVPQISIVFLSGDAQTDDGTFFLSNFDWRKAYMMDISSVENYEEFFNSLNNFLTFGHLDEPEDIFVQLRGFAESTGRLAMIFFEGSK
ncbi:MAG: hypothetical protein ABJJ37_27110 [Roseibium sp.]